MGEIKILYLKGQLTVANIKHDDAKNTTPPVETNVLEIKTANDWIEEAKTKPIRLLRSAVHGVISYNSYKNNSRMHDTYS